MPVAKLTSKGQLVIPKEIRDLLRLQPGDRIDFVVREDGEVVIRPLVVDVRELKGSLHASGRAPVSLETMKETVRRRAGERNR